ncbi:Uncharacterised protein [Burkholderia pseudomallei]|uniref:hypothetical protein n=1 Tax=Burkholderia TaxID=32008 RepID=UPI000A9E0DE9|nr:MULTISPECIES: hypothetical protein [Burkholderia]CAJ6883888.1 Uncharacterised protein [Burkholderia pseudomallei]VBI24380.1 Uncharacterised protein [Burkholderia pseudomallei]
MKNAQQPTITMKFRGYFAAKTGADQWLLRGRGERRVVTHSELLNLANARPKRKAGAR